ncbi:unnamed protein product [Linum tenue]|uniref:RNA-binding protein 25 n=1 Tax=Linum tenue TaxID=586396 RepID=A0AAV0HM49_9ROSI|nr:unnamed protein product [Linum tenue]
MAEPPPSASAAAPGSNPPPSEPGNAIPQSDPAPAPSPAPPQQPQSSIAPPPNPNPNPNPSPTTNSTNTLVPPPPPAFPSAYGLPPPHPMSGAAMPPVAPSFRPIPQFAPLPNYQNQSAIGVQPPGVSAGPPAMPHYQAPPGQPILRPPYATLPNGYPPVPGATPQGIMPPPGGLFLFCPSFPTLYLSSSLYILIRSWFTLLCGFMNCQQQTMLATECSLAVCLRLSVQLVILYAYGMARYPSPYPAMIRPIFTPRPPGAPVILPMTRPLVPSIPGVRPIIPPIMRPVIPSVTPAEKPQTTVYVGKISPTVENDFMLSLLQVSCHGFAPAQLNPYLIYLMSVTYGKQFMKSCGTVKSWKRAQDPSDGTPRGFGFCEFENAEGVLRALRLLSKFNIDGQELVLNVNQATREYLDRYVEKKTENSKNLREGGAKQDVAPNNAEKTEPSESSEKAGTMKSSPDVSESDNEKADKGGHDLANFGIVTNEDKEGDKAAQEKLYNMIEERLKTKPLPPPPPPPPPPQLLIDGSGNPNTEQTKSRDGDSETDALKSDDAAEEKNNDAASEHERPEVSSPDRNRRYDRRGRDKERDLKREKEREIERYERETERERIRKERELRRKVEDAEREYEERLRDWEYREREKEKQRQYEKEREKERDRKRKKEILHDEEDEDDDSGKRWRRSVIEERRKKRQREKEEDLADRLKEEEEIVEAKKKAEEEKLLEQEKEVLKLPHADIVNGSEKPASSDGMFIETTHKVNDEGVQNGAGEVSTVPMVESEAQCQSANAPTRKLGFGLVGSGKRAAVPSVFHEEDDDPHKDKKMRPLVPIDYSTEELQAVQPITSGAQPPNLVAAAEYAKQISNIAPREEKSEVARDKNQRSHDRSGRRDKNDEDSNHRSREENRDRDHGLDKVKTPDKQKLLDAKQLIDMIPKTKDELFSYEINWTVYDKHSLHDRMRPWISKKITEFLGEEETTLVDYIVSSTREHVKAAQMLEMLQSILDDEAEMFVLKMWRMLIFEIKKVESGLGLKSKP